MPSMQHFTHFNDEFASCLKEPAGGDYCGSLGDAAREHVGKQGHVPLGAVERKLESGGVILTREMGCSGLPAIQPEVRNHPWQG